MKNSFNLLNQAQIINIVIVDDHPIVRQSLANMFCVYGDPFRVLGSAKNAEDALAMLQNIQPDVMLTDLQMLPTSGIALIHSVRHRHPKIRFVVFTASAQEEHILQAFDAGAQGYVVKDAEEGELLKAIEVVANGYTHYPSSINQALERRSHKPKLTAREAEVLSFIADGLTSKEIARKLAVDFRTIETHRSKIRQRFGLANSAALLRFAIENKSGN